MTRRMRLLIGSAVALLVLVAAVGAAAHDGKKNDDGDHGGGRVVFAASLAPSLSSDPAIHGVAAGGLPWALGRGSVRLSRNGELRVKIRGLVIPVAHGTFPAGVASPVTTVTASLYCAPDSSAAVATTASAPISASGDARIEDDLTLPATCLAPIVLVHPNGGLAAYIASSGWRR
jgi:hypothetical protein